MIIDAIMFHNEYEMLEFRLRYLYDYVDKFVIVEADRTHSGNEKGSNFLANKDRFDWAMNKIEYHFVNIDVTGLNFTIQPKEFDFDAPQWRVENQQRNAISDACAEFSDTDVVMMSDCDEIPTRQVIEFRKANDVQNPFACDQRIVAFYLNYVRDDIGWRGTIVSTLKQVREITSQGLRNMRIRLSPFPYGGWHMTFFGGAEQIRSKLKSYAHAENNKEEYLSMDIESLTRNGKGIFPDAGQPLRKVDVSFYPPDLLENAPKEWWA